MGYFLRSNPLWMYKILNMYRYIRLDIITKVYITRSLALIWVFDNSYYLAKVNLDSNKTLELNWPTSKTSSSCSLRGKGSWSMRNK